VAFFVGSLGHVYYYIILILKKLTCGALKINACGNAKLFPMVNLPEMLDIGMWLMGPLSDESGKLVKLWRNYQRVSLEELHRFINYHKLCASSTSHQADLAFEIARACIGYGLLGQDLSQLC
jgi:fucokinase